MRSLAFSTRGRGVNACDRKCFEWCSKAADEGDAAAMNNVGLFFLAGEGTDQDLAAGIAWMKQAGQCGYAQAYCNLARFYDSGEFLSKMLI